MLRVILSRLSFSEVISECNTRYHYLSQALQDIGTAKPGQLLVGDFYRPGQPGEILNPEGVIKQANELFRAEGYGAATLSFEPKSRVRAVDKHGVSWYCWNVTGEVPNIVGEEKLRVKVGLEPDTAPELSDIRFRIPT
jgi:hypothetical protein